MNFGIFHALCGKKFVKVRERSTLGDKGIAVILGRIL